jgi:hypothetical protein
MWIVGYGYESSAGIFKNSMEARNRVGIGWPYRARICKPLRRPGIDSEDWIPPAYVAWRAGMTNRVVVPACHAGNRFLDSLKSLQIRAQAWRNWFLGIDSWAP